MREGKIQRGINPFGRLGLSAKDFSERCVKKYEKDVPDVVRTCEGKIQFKGFMEVLKFAKAWHQSSRVMSVSV